MVPAEEEEIHGVSNMSHVSSHLLDQFYLPRMSTMFFFFPFLISSFGRRGGPYIIVLVVSFRCQLERRRESTHIPFDRGNGTSPLPLAAFSSPSSFQKLSPTHSFHHSVASMEMGRRRLLFQLIARLSFMLRKWRRAFESHWRNSLPWMDSYVWFSGMESLSSHSCLLESFIICVRFAQTSCIDDRSNGCLVYGFYSRSKCFPMVVHLLQEPSHWWKILYRAVAAIQSIVFGSCRDPNTSDRGWHSPLPSCHDGRTELYITVSAPISSSTIIVVEERDIGGFRLPLLFVGKDVRGLFMDGMETSLSSYRRVRVWTDSMDDQRPNSILFRGPFCVSPRRRTRYIVFLSHRGSSSMSDIAFWNGLFSVLPRRHGESPSSLVSSSGIPTFI